MAFLENMYDLKDIIETEEIFCGKRLLYVYGAYSFRNDFTPFWEHYRAQYVAKEELLHQHSRYVNIAGSI